MCFDPALYWSTDNAAPQDVQSRKAAFVDGVTGQGYANQCRSMLGRPVPRCDMTGMRSLHVRARPILSAQKWISDCALKMDRLVLVSYEMMGAS